MPQVSERPPVILDIGGEGKDTIAQCRFSRTGLAAGIEIAHSSHGVSDEAKIMEKMISFSIEIRPALGVVGVDHISLAYKVS